MPRPRDLTGLRFGRLVVLGLATSVPGNPNRRWATRCDCGLHTVVFGMDLVSGRTSSCGCFRKDVLRTHPQTLAHGQSKRLGRKPSPEYVAWAGIRRRCLNAKDPAYPQYGGRGIKICERWGKFENFFADMGPRPSPKHSVDRYPNNNGDYEPSNCRWATPTEQARNRRTSRRVTFQGQELTLVAWAEKMTLPYGTLLRRLTRGWPFDVALTTPVDTTRRNLRAKRVSR